MSRGTLIAVLILVIAAIALIAFFARPKPTETWIDEVTAKRQITSLERRITDFNWAIAIATAVSAFLAPMLRSFWPAIPLKRYFYPALTLFAVGTGLLVVLALSPVWAPGGVVFGFDPRVLRSTAIVRSTKDLNLLAVGLVAIPLVVGLALYVLDRLAAHVFSPVARARKQTG